MLRFPQQINTDDRLFPLGVISSLAFHAWGSWLFSCYSGWSFSGSLKTWSTSRLSPAPSPLSLPSLWDSSCTPQHRSLPKCQCFQRTPQSTALLSASYSYDRNWLYDPAPKIWPSILTLVAQSVGDLLLSPCSIRNVSPRLKSLLLKCLLNSFISLHPHCFHPSPRHLRL